MTIEDTQAATDEAVVSEAEQTSSQDVTDGSASSAEAVEARTPAEQASDEFLKEFGEAKEDGQEPEPPVEPEKAPEEAKAEPERKDGAEAGKRISDDVFKALPPEARERIGYLSDQVRTFKREVEEARPQVEALLQLQAYAEENGLRGEDVTKGLAIMGNLQSGRFQEFLDAVMPFVATAQQALGLAVSPEIQAMVDAGDMTQEAALKMSQAEQRRVIAERNAALLQERTQEEAATAAQQRHVQALQAAARNTEALLRAQDPAFAQKEPAIKALFGEMLRNAGLPKDVAAVEAMLRTIHANVSIATPAPVPRATTQRPTASEPPRRAAAPESTLDQIRATLGL